MASEVKQEHVCPILTYRISGRNRPGIGIDRVRDLRVLRRCGECLEVEFFLVDV